MKLIVRNLCSALTLCLLIIQSAHSQSGEISSLQFRRDASNSQTPLEGTFQKNVYRYEQRQETYIEQVPYTVTVPYQDTETYYENEYQCRNIPVSRQVCYNENRCEEVRVPRQVCRDIPTCSRPVPGQPCPTRRECRTEYGHERRCFNRPICRTETHYENRCEYIRVPRTRTVTRYRNETHYRAETRVRTITVPVFERTYTVGLSIEFPANTALLAGESESIQATLGGSENAPSVSVQVQSSLFRYNVVDQRFVRGELQVTLAASPRYQPGELGAETVQNLDFDFTGGSLALQFQDQGTAPRITTSYSVTLRSGNGAVLFDGPLASNGVGSDGLVRLVVPGGFNRQQDYTATLAVKREGSTLTGGVAFEKSANYLSKLDPAQFTDASLVGGLAIHGRQFEAVLAFYDRSPTHADVRTSYTIHVSHLNGLNNERDLGSSTVLRSALSQGSDGTMRIPFESISGIDSTELRKDFKRGDKIIVRIEVARESQRLREVSPIRFSRGSEIKIQ